MLNDEAMYRLRTRIKYVKDTDIPPGDAAIAIGLSEVAAGLSRIGAALESLKPQPSLPADDPMATYRQAGV